MKINKPTALHWCALWDFALITRLLIAAGANVHAQATDLHDTPLLWAVRNNSLASARVLLDAHAWDNDSCIQSVNSPSRRSMRYAIVNASLDMIRLLLNQCNINVIQAVGLSCGQM